ncbi:hypothetical protein BAXH7_00436 [Bacillus amyloliquefaciens XH7]|nr:hypothetical protein BAXH7_00436 [Bacillus amyloliquefaciens XH7]
MRIILHRPRHVYHSFMKSVSRLKKKKTASSKRMTAIFTRDQQFPNKI